MSQLLALPLTLAFFVIVGLILSLLRSDLRSMSSIAKFAIGATAGSALIGVSAGFIVKVLQAAVPAISGLMIGVYYIVVPIAGVLCGLWFVKATSRTDG